MARFNYYLGASISSWLLVILIIWAELSAPFKEALKSMFSHHWLGKAVIIIVVFIIFGFLLKNKNKIGKYSDEKISWFSVLASLIIILLFYIIEFFK